MSPSSRTRWWLASSSLSLVLSAACYQDNPAYREYQVSADTYLPTVLAPGAKIAFYGVGTRRTYATVWPFDGGGFVAAVATIPLFEVGDVVSFQSGLVHASPTGRVSTETVHAGSVIGASLGDDALLAFCGGERFVALAGPDAALPRLTDQTPPTDGYDVCAAVYGRGAATGRVIHATPGLEAVFLHTVDRATLSHSAVPLFRGVVAPGTVSVLFVDEPQLDQVAIVGSAGDALVYVDPKQPDARVTATGLSGTLGPSPVWRGKDGLLRIATTTGLFSWNPAQAAVTKVADTPASPTGTPWALAGGRGGAYAERTEPNPRAPAGEAEVVPVQMATLSADDGGFSVFEPPLTPCCDRDACRTGGESYVLGGHPAGATNVTFYDVWSWQLCLGRVDCYYNKAAMASNGYHALIAAPSPADCGAQSP